MKTLDVLDKVLKGKRVSLNTQRHYRDVLSSLSCSSQERGHLTTTLIREG